MSFDKIYSQLLEKQGFFKKHLGGVFLKFSCFQMSINFKQKIFRADRIKGQKGQFSPFPTPVFQKLFKNAFFASKCF